MLGARSWHPELEQGRARPFPSLLPLPRCGGPGAAPLPPQPAPLCSPPHASRRGTPSFIAFWEGGKKEEKRGNEKQPVPPSAPRGAPSPAARGGEGRAAVPGEQPPAPPAPPGQRAPYPESFPIFTKLNTSIHAAGQLCPSLAHSLQQQQQQLHVGRRLRPAAATALAEAAAGGGSGCYPPPAGSWACSISQELAIHLRAALPLRPPLPCPSFPPGGLRARARCRGSRRQPGSPPRRAAGRRRGRRRRLSPASPEREEGARQGGRKVEGVEGGVSPPAGDVSPSRGGAEGAGGGGPGERRPLAPAGGGRREPAGHRGLAAPWRGRGSGLEGGTPGKAPHRSWRSALGLGKGWSSCESSSWGKQAALGAPVVSQGCLHVPVRWGRGCRPSASALGAPQPWAADLPGCDLCPCP